jgi:hypothetical protein
MNKTYAFPEFSFAMMQSKIDHQNSIATQEKQG